MAILESHDSEKIAFTINHPASEQNLRIVKKLRNSELSLHIIYLDFTGQFLVVCTGPCGESFSFIEKEDVKTLLIRSLAIHQRIDRLIGNSIEEKGITKIQHRKLSSDLRELGKFLFTAVFHGDILDIFNMTIGQACQMNIDVLIRVMVADDFINIIPWELLCDDETYLCHVHDIIRHPFILQPVKYPISHNSTARVLFVGANPLKDIRVQGEIEAVEAAFETKKDIHCLLSPDANYTNIANAIYDGIDILHFLAHGEYENSEHASKYYFVIDNEDENKGHDRLPIEMLESFCRANPMRFAVLNACRSDQAINYNLRSLDKLVGTRYHSMAHALIQTGVPCVVGMSHPISKGGAELFTRRLYRTVIDRKESVSKALRLARLELFAHSDDLLPSDWLTPVLYSRGLQEE